MTTKGRTMDAHKRTWTCSFCRTLNQFWRRRCRICGLWKKRPTEGGAKWRRKAKP